MRKLSTFFLSIVLLMSIFVQKGCVKSTDPVDFESGVEILSPADESMYIPGQNITVVTKLTGYTFEYSQVNYYLGDSETPAKVVNKSDLNLIAEDQPKNPEFEVEVPTDGIIPGTMNLVVEAVDSYNVKVTDILTVIIFTPAGTVDIVITDPAGTDNVIQGNDVTFQITLNSIHGLEYFDELRFFVDNNPTGLPVTLSETGTSYSFDYVLQTTGYTVDNHVLKVEMRSIGSEIIEGTREFAVVRETSLIDFTILTPASDGLEFNLGERIEVAVQVTGNLSLYKNLSAYIGSSEVPFYTNNEPDEYKYFDFSTEVDFEAGNYNLRIRLTNTDDLAQTKTRSFSLIEYIPTFRIGIDSNIGVNTSAGYELKSIIQTYDNGYLTVSSRDGVGTRIVKYDKEGEQIWAQTLAASTGIGESVVEDIEYDKGYVIAGWRQDGLWKNTWVRKISHVDGSLIWNKSYGYDHCNDAATVIKKTIDDGYIIGGWTENYYGTDPFEISWEITTQTESGTVTEINTHTSSWETGYDVRFLKIYSNGNEVWGHHSRYISHRLWQDITLHKESDPDNYWVRKMGDQMITDLVAKEDGNYYVTGWNNWYLSGVDRSKNDMFFAEIDNFGGFVSTMTWNRMTAYDMDNLASEEDDFFIDPGYSYMLNYEIIVANHLGDITENEVGYGLVESQGGFGGQVVMAGETHQTDSKAKLHDAWVVEFGINADEDGALWEYSFGEVAKHDKAFGIDKTKDGGYIVTGATGYTTEAEQDTWLFKLDSQLSLQWSRNLGRTGQDTGVKVLQASDGGYVVGGNSGDGAGVQARIIKVNKAGELGKK